MERFHAPSGIAFACCVNPRVRLSIIATACSPITGDAINDLIIKLQKELGVTSIVVTHDMDSAFAVSDRFAMLYNHRIEWTGPVDQARRTENATVRSFIEGNIGA